KFHGLSPIVFSPNSGYASSAWEAAQKLQEELGIEREGFAENLLLQQRDLLQCEDSAGDNEALKELLIAGLEEAFADFDALRAREGSELKLDFARRLQTLEEILATLENLVEGGALTQKEKLTEKLKALLGNAPLDDLIARELALLADKVDVCEELVRFRAHLSHFSETMELPGLQGKTLDFILQEMFREINTIGSKTQDSAVTRKVVEAKTEIERIREQVQNIE
ncbi:MAG: DUF1732 domain-containing protein, partial [Chlamydiia bacterium]|nr:DUF1732 domain-containing protein [Chlamydiia bacterium]